MTAPGFDLEGGEEFSELVDGVFPRVDLVGKAANGVPRFLICKAADAAGNRGLLEASIVRGLVSKASADLSAVPRADLLRQVATGSAEQKRAALLELGTRDAHGLPDPSPAPVQKPMTDMDGNAVKPVTDLTAAPPASVGLPADAPAGAVAKAAGLGGLTPAGAAFAALRAGQPVRKSREEEVHRSTVSHQDGLPSYVVADRPWLEGLSSEEQARRGSVLGLQPALGGSEAERAVIGKAVAVGMEAERAVSAGTLSPAAAALVRLRANQAAAQQIAALRASGQGGVVRKAKAPDTTVTLAEYQRRYGVGHFAKVTAASRRRQGKG